MLILALLTPVMVVLLLLAALTGTGHRWRLDRVFPRMWGRAVLWAAGVDITVHGQERLDGSRSVIFASNHVSFFDVLTLLVSLPPSYFVAKAELFDIPIFGRGIRAVGTIPIARTQQKAAFESYDIAAERIRAGSSVVVFPEGTRGTSYEIRPFKKGPFVLAIKAGAPIVPCIVHGTMEILPKKSLRLYPGHVDLHILDPVPTAGLQYDDRNALARDVHDSMASAMDTLYPQPT
jgi:1-acyl-sn-glycerol-3-phosphate acyltransferase